MGRGPLTRRNAPLSPLTSASQDTGPAALAKWERRNGHRPDDEFVELISYRETKRYVKKVVSNHLAYQALYQPSAS